MQTKSQLMNEQDIERALMRIAHEIIERNRGVENTALVGIQRRGVPLARRIAAHMQKAEGARVPVGILDITLYRDDLSLLDTHPVLNGTDIGFCVSDKTVVMVDDVLYTGRTARAAMDALMEMGRPRAIQLAALVDRGHQELPIRADYVGKYVPTARDEIISVRVRPVDDVPEETVVIVTREARV